jgi:4-phosphopantoate---beta-alanine ligase
LCGTNVDSIEKSHECTGFVRLQLQYDDAGRVAILPTPAQGDGTCRGDSPQPWIKPRDIERSTVRSASDLSFSTRHPRFLSLKTRDDLVKAAATGLVVPQGLIAHGRGEAFDYVLGERTIPAASSATMAGAALLLKAESPVISVNGNSAALAGEEIVTLASTVSASIEVNLFHRTLEREKLIARHLMKFGAKQILGVGSAASKIIGGVSSPRAKVDPNGIGKADVVLVPLEDGDRAQALEHGGKKIISIDLNPLSRTSQVASVSIVDNIVRAIPALIKASREMKELTDSQLEKYTLNFDNDTNLANAIRQMVDYLQGWIKN